MTERAKSSPEGGAGIERSEMTERVQKLPAARFQVLALRPARGILTIAQSGLWPGNFLRREGPQLKNLMRRWAALACVLLCLALAGCSALPGERAQVEELLRAPKLSGDYGDVQTALNDWLGESAQLKYPMQGELLSPFLLQDLDGDGQMDAAVLYTTAQSTNVCIAILQKTDADGWQVRQNVEGLSDTVESVGLAQLQPGDGAQLVVGYLSAQGDHYLAVYSYAQNQLSTILEQLLRCEGYKNRRGTGSQATTNLDQVLCQRQATHQPGFLLKIQTTQIAVMLLGDALCLEHIVFQFLLRAPGVQHQKSDEEHPLVLAL